MILSGRCNAHRWLEICEEQIHFHDAHTLWGSGIGECRKMLSDRLDYDAYSCLCIGSAGEDLLPAATVISDGRAAGRAGFGAVLGWKNLKAITVTGSKPIPIYSKEKNHSRKQKMVSLSGKKHQKSSVFSFVQVAYNPKLTPIEGFGSSIFGQKLEKHRISFEIRCFLWCECSYRTFQKTLSYQRIRYNKLRKLKRV